MERDTNATTPPAHREPPRRRSSTISSVKSAADSIVQTTRRAAGSAGQSALNVLNADPPLGAWAATAQATSQAPTLAEIRQGALSQEAAQRPRSRSNPHQRGQQRRSRTGAGLALPVPEEGPRDAQGDDANKALKEDAEPFPRLEEVEMGAGMVPTTQDEQDAVLDATSREEKETNTNKDGETRTRATSSGYVPPPRLPWTSSAWIGFKAFLKWTSRPLGFFITIYSLNVVAWGGMLFLLLCGAGPAMCNAPDGRGGTFYDCDDLYSPRRVWIEIDSQILNALFCVTGFGLVPWRFRDLYYLLRWRLCPARRYGMATKLYGLRKLGGINRNWVRLPESDTIGQISSAAYLAARPGLATHHTTDREHGDMAIEDPRLPLPLKKAPDDPLTGVRAPPTALWKLDFFIWCQIMNTVLQTVLCYFMWAYSRYTRPSWATGLFIALACIVAGIAGIVSYVEGRRIKRVEGARASEAVQREILRLHLVNDGTPFTPQDTETVRDGRQDVHHDHKEKLR